jgi:CRP/FNR family transcriptional regulator, cyclic AMP receptor protein
MLEAHLTEVPFFSSLSKREIQEIARATDEIDVKQGEVLAREGDVGQEFFVIIEGSAEVVRGGERIAELGKGDFFGEMALVGDEPRMATVSATAPMRVAVMSRSAFRGFDRMMPAVHARIVEAIEARRAAASS